MPNNGLGMAEFTIVNLLTWSTSIVALRNWILLQQADCRELLTNCETTVELIYLCQKECGRRWRPNPLCVMISFHVLGGVSSGEEGH